MKEEMGNSIMWIDVLLMIVKVEASPFCTSFMPITLYVPKGVFVYILSFKCMSFLSHLFSTVAVGIGKFCLQLCYCYFLKCCIEICLEIIGLGGKFFFYS